MHISVTGKKVEVTDALREYAESRFLKLKKYVDNASVTLVLTVEKHRNIAEVTINYKGGSTHCSEETKEMYSTIDKLMDKVEKQFRRIKEKQVHHKGDERASTLVEE